MKLSEHFTYEELTITTVPGMVEPNRKEGMAFVGSLKRVAEELLEPVRVGLGKPLVVTSGYRGSVLNAQIGGAATSQHCKGEAADFNVRGYLDRAGQVSVVRWILEDFKVRGYKFGQLLLERGCIHVSLGTKCEVAEYDVPTKTKKPIPELAELA